MKNIFILLLTTFIGMFESNAQVMYQKFIGNEYHDNPMSVTMCSDGGYLIGGTSDVNGIHIFMTKLFITGDTAWTRMYSGSTLDMAMDCGQTNDGGYFIAGTATTQGDFLLVKTDGNGTVLWSNLYGTSAEDACWSAIETSDNGFMLAGKTGITNSNILIVKTDSTGIIEWTRMIDASSSDWVSSVQQTIDGGYCIVGLFSNGSQTGNVSLIKLNNTGVLEWYKSYDLGFNDYGRSVYLTSDGGFIMAGLSYASNGNVVVIKTDSLGQLMWSKTYDTGSTDYGFDVIQTTDGGYAVTGTTSFLVGTTTNLLIRTDSLGSPLWSKIYTEGSGHYDHFPMLLQSADNGFLIAAQSTITITGFADIYVIKTDSIGNSGCNEVVVSPVAQVFTPVVNIGTPITSAPLLNTVTYGLVQSAGATVTTNCFTSSLEEEMSSRNYLQVFPNPANNTISFNGIYERIREVSIINSLGSRVLHADHGSFEMDATMDISDLKQGMYFVTLTTETHVRCAKFVKE